MSKQLSMGKLSIANARQSNEKLFRNNNTKSCFYWFSYGIDVLLNVKSVIQYLSIVCCLYFIRLLAAFPIASTLLSESIFFNASFKPFEHSRCTTLQRASNEMFSLRFFAFYLCEAELGLWEFKCFKYCIFLVFVSSSKVNETWANVWRTRTEESKTKRKESLGFFCFITHLLFHFVCRRIHENLKQWVFSRVNVLS